MRRFIAFLWLCGAMALGLAARPVRAQNAPASASQIASLRYSLTVDPDTLQINNTVTYTIRIENTPGSGIQLDSVVAFFKIPQLSNGRLLLDPASFSVVQGDAPVGFPNNFVDPATGQIRWNFASISRGAPVIIVFSFNLGDITTISLQSCGENYLNATLDVTAKDRGVIVRPGQRSAESILDVRPDMRMVSIVSARATQRGDTARYTINYSNHGNVGDDATVCVLLPPGADYNNVQVTPSTITKTLVSADSICFDVGLVRADSMVNSFTLRVPLSGSIPAEIKEVCIRARIDSPCDTLLTNNVLPPESRACIPLDPLDLLSITKSVNTDTVVVGDIVRYTIRYTNIDSNVTAYNVRIFDTLPLGTQFLSADPPFEFANGVVSWRYDSLAPGVSGELHYSVLVPLSFYHGQTNTLACRGMPVNNLVRITSTGPAGQPTPESDARMDNNVSARSVFVRPLGDLLALRVDVDTSRANPAAATLQPGDTLTFKLYFRNNSTRLPATNATLVDTLPDANIVSLLQPLPPQFELANNRLIRGNLMLAPGQEDSVLFRLVIRTDIASCTAQTILNRAGIRDSLEFDCNLANNVDRKTLQMQPSGDLMAVELAADRRVIVDTLGQVSFTLVYRNTGTIDALNVVVMDSLPPALEFVSSIPARSRSPRENVSLWDIGTLAPGAADTILINARVRRGVVACDSARFTSGAQISSQPVDCNLGNNISAITLTLITDPAQQPQLVLQADSTSITDQNNDGCAEPDEIITVRLRFHNMSLVAATQIDASQLQTTLADIQSFSFAPATLPPGQTGTATFVLRAGASDQANSLAFSGQISANGFCPRPFSASYCFKPRARVDFTAPAGSVPVSIDDLKGDSNGCAGDAEPLSVVVRYQNNSTIPADSVDLKVVLTPPGFTLISSSPPVMPSGAAGDTFKLRVSLAPNQSGSLTLQISYPDFNVRQVMVSTSASLKVSAIAAAVVQEAAIAVCHDCHARPNPFIPSRHLDAAQNMHGVRFAPNDAQTVEIFDLQGNRVRTLNTRETWDGKDDHRRDCPAGVYLWVIKGEGGCRGTIVVVR